MHVTSLATNMRLPHPVVHTELSSKVCIVGRSWSGKTNLIQSLQLALTNAAYDFGGRDATRSVKSPALIRQVMGPQAEEIAITAVFGSQPYLWKVGTSGKVAWNPPSAFQSVCFPVERALALSGSAAATVQKYLFEHFVCLLNETIPDYEGFDLGVVRRSSSLKLGRFRNTHVLLDVLEHLRKTLAVKKKTLKALEDQLRTAIVSNIVQQMAHEQCKKQIEQLLRVSGRCWEIIQQELQVRIKNINQEINTYLPSWFGSIDLDLTSGKVVLTRDNIPRTILSGSEWAILGFAIALAATKSNETQEFCVFTLPDRSYDAETFTDILRWIRSFPICAWITTTHGSQVVPSGYSVIIL